MTVHAPFRFSPINRWVYFPEWADAVSHDIPFVDGYSGEIHFQAKAITPLLVGGPRRPARPQKRDANNNVVDPGQVGEVRPFQLPNGDHAIPGSSWQGLIRQILEIATFGKLGERIEDRRFGFRSLTDDMTSVLAYRERMTTLTPGARPALVTQHAKAGWLVKSGEDKFVVPCDYARIEFRDVQNLWTTAGGTGANILDDATDAKRRYKWFTDAPRAQLDISLYVDNGPIPNHHKHGDIQIYYKRARPIARPNTKLEGGTLVFTGKAGRKHMEFFFHGPGRATVTGPALKTLGAIKINADVWRDFESIHFEQTGRNVNPNWEYWEADFKCGKPVPVFYLEEPSGSTTVTTMGTAFMFKTAQPLSTHNLLRNSTKDHFCERVDFPSLIFGAVADEGRGLKRRASFDLSRISPADLPENTQVELSRNATVLASPKPSYFPLYVRQPPGAQGGQLPAGKPYATYDNFAGRPAEMQEGLLDAHTRPELMGAKIWPAIDANSSFPDLPIAPRGAGPGVQVKLKALPEGTTFPGTLRFHNLREVELGALLWAMTLGDVAKFKDHGERVHRLGMGKPFGMGAISIKITGLSLAHRSQPSDPTVFMKGAMKTFTDHMSIYETESGAVGAWEDSVQIKTLVKASRRSDNADLDAFKYMSLIMGNRAPNEHLNKNDFSDAKADNQRRFLPPYTSGNEPPAGLRPRKGASILLPARGLIGQIISSGPDGGGFWDIQLEGESRPVRLHPKFFTVIDTAL